MQTPALAAFLKETGKVVHFLNTIAVGLSSVETGVAVRPSGLDVSWNPSNRQSSGRQARAFTQRATIVFVAEEFCEYVLCISKSPACSEQLVHLKQDRASRVTSLNKHFSLDEDYSFLGPLLLVHWRNRIVHPRRSNAGLTRPQRSSFIHDSEIVKAKYKNLDPAITLAHFDENRPSLKDVSSLVSMTINYVKGIEARIPEPTSRDEVIAWLISLGLAEKLDRVKRESQAKGKRRVGEQTFLNTHFPAIAEHYFRFCFEEA